MSRPAKAGGGLIGGWLRAGLVVAAIAAAGPAYAHAIGGTDAAFVAATKGPDPIPFLYLGAKHMVTAGSKDPHDFHFDFHGHTTPQPGGEGMTVASYRQAYGLHQQGALTAPFDGIQGWQFSNSGDAPLVVRLRLAGFYELIPSGQPGNEAGVVANVPAAQSRPKVDPRDAVGG